MRYSWAVPSVLVMIGCAVGAISGACSVNRDDEGGALGNPADSAVVTETDAGALDVVDPGEGLPVPTGPFGDFPASPIIDDKTTTAAPTLFGGKDTGDKSGGPCVLEPEMGALLPRNWLRPRFHFIPAPGQTLFELRLHADDELSDLVVYTASTSWIMPADMWAKVTAHLIDKPITVSVRGAKFDGTKLDGVPALGSTGVVTVAPATAEGSIVYWMLEGTVPGESVLKGFSVGQETVTEVLRPKDVAAKCIGCHSSTPDGQFVAMDGSDDPSTGAPTRIVLRGTKDPTLEPSFLTPSAKNLLGRLNQHGGVFSKAHWSAGDRTLLSAWPNGSSRFELMWTDLEAKSEAKDVGWGILARDGDTGGAGAPAFSHDGTRIVYFSSAAVESGMITADGSGELRIIPYASRKGGASIALTKDITTSSWQPSFSPDDKLVAFNRGPRGTRSVEVPSAEVFVVPSTGASAPTRVVGNDPPACSGQKSPGVTNSWPKWAPQAATIGSKTYYWITFSSNRDESKIPQLYVAGVVVEGDKITSYPALYLWNQPSTEHNHTPAWDVFALPGPK